MCGRFTQHSELAILAERFGAPLPELDFRPRYNLAPGQDAMVVVQDPERRLLPMRWGLVPAWVKDSHATPRPINARAENAADKPMFRQAFRQRRCLVPADGFYEWQPGAKGQAKTPLLFQRRDRAPFAMAGLWESWRGPDGQELLTFAILTTLANDLVRPVHDRMPVILAPDDEAPWLDPTRRDPRALAELVRPYPAGSMQAHRVSPAVNSIANEGPELLTPVPEQPSLV